MTRLTVGRVATVAARALGALLIIRLIWYAAVVVAVPLVPARDDQAGREAIVRAIEDGSLTRSLDRFADAIVSLPIGSADLSVGGYVSLFERRPLVVGFYANLGLGRWDGWVYVASGRRADLDVRETIESAEQVAPDWFYVYAA